MDQNQFQAFLEHQTKIFQQLMQKQPPPTPLLPGPLSFEGDMEKNFDFFVQSWQDYSKAIGMDQWPPELNAIRVSLLLAVIGEPVKNYNLPATKLDSPDTALQAISAKVVKEPAKRNVISRFMGFLTGKQGPLECIDGYVARLKRLAKFAKLGTLEPELLTYKIVTSNKWQHLRPVMRKIGNITFEKALDLCRAQETDTDQPQPQDVTVGALDVPSKSDHHTAQRRSATAKGKNSTVSIPRRSPDQAVRFLDTDFKLTDLHNWISGYVGSEHETPSEFIQTLATALMERKTKPIDEAGLDECVNMMFEKAVSEPNCSEGYAKLARELGPAYVSTEKRPFSFKSRLLTLCQKEFEQRCTDRIKLGLINNPVKKEADELKVELDEEEQKMQRRAVGTVRFIGELYTHGLLTSSIMRDVIKRLIETGDIAYDEEPLECLCKLLTTIGSKMEESDQDMTNYFRRMGEIVRHMEQTQMGSKVRFMIQDVIDLRRNGWKVE